MYQVRDPTLANIARLGTSRHWAISTSQIHTLVPFLARGVKLHLPTGRIVPLLPPSPGPEPWQRRDVGVLGAAGAAVAASVLVHPAAQSGAG